jgi:hypothetical protein
LPPEILDKIYSVIPHPQAQIAFSLCCRTFASVAASSFTPLKDGKTILRSGVHAYDKEHLLADLLRWNFIHPKLDLRLCTSCWKYLPRNRVWYTREGSRLTTLKRVDWSFAIMQWMNDSKCKTCPTCQIPEGYDDEVKGRFLQDWDSGFAQGTLRVQEYGCEEVCEEDARDDDDDDSH